MLGGASAARDPVVGRGGVGITGSRYSEFSLVARGLRRKGKTYLALTAEIAGF